MILSSWGLSPHIRGNVHRGARRSPGHGSIPAHTGERRSRPPSDQQSRVYPRTYGGTHLEWLAVHAVEGLSPHIRGNGRNHQRNQFCRGSIPAHTGERDVCPNCSYHLRVYPRTYGGTRIILKRGKNIEGLSPHIRGNGIPRIRTGCAWGSIPAHTGERVSGSYSSSAIRVYPRTYGGTC